MPTGLEGVQDKRGSGRLKPGGNALNEQRGGALRPEGRCHDAALCRRDQEARTTRWARQLNPLGWGGATACTGKQARRTSAPSREAGGVAARRAGRGARRGGAVGEAGRGRLGLVAARRLLQARLEGREDALELPAHLSVRAGRGGGGRSCQARLVARSKHACAPTQPLPPPCMHACTLARAPACRRWAARPAARIWRAASTCPCAARTPPARPRALRPYAIGGAMGEALEAGWGGRGGRGRHSAARSGGLALGAGPADSAAATSPRSDVPPLLGGPGRPGAPAPEAAHHRP
jgi:hypothetical protein